MKYCYELTHQKDICLPSTSPANAAYSLDKLLIEWQQYVRNLWKVHNCHI